MPNLLLRSDDVQSPEPATYENLAKPNKRECF